MHAFRWTANACKAKCTREIRSVRITSFFVGQLCCLADATGQMLGRLNKAVLAFWTDETGGEVLEYALVAGLIVVGAISLISKIGNKVLARWTSLNSSM